MRLPIVPPLSTKDGASNKNARLTNCLKESKKTGDKAVIRPGLVASDTYSGLGNGLIPFDGRLLLIFNDSIYTEDLPEFPFPLDSAQWDSATSYDFNDTVFYQGDLWFSWETGNSNNTPSATSVYWKRGPKLDTFDPATPYGLGDSALVGGVPYYSYADSNTGNPPADNPNLWSTTPPPATRYRGRSGPSYGPIAATYAAAGNAFYLSVIYPLQGTCAIALGNGSYTFFPTFIGADATSIYADTYINQAPYNCSSSVGTGTSVIGSMTVYP